MFLVGHTRTHTVNIITHLALCWGWRIIFELAKIVISKLISSALSNVIEFQNKTVRKTFTFVHKIYFG